MELDRGVVLTGRVVMEESLRPYFGVDLVLAPIGIEAQWSGEGSMGIDVSGQGQLHRLAEDVLPQL